MTKIRLTSAIFSLLCQSAKSKIMWYVGIQGNKEGHVSQSNPFFCFSEPSL